MSCEALLEIAVPGPFHEGLHYSIPESIQEKNLLLPGTRVLVPLGTKKVVGVILSRLSHDPTQTHPFLLKPIEAILDPEPIYTSALFELILWLSRYYHHPIGDTFQTALIGPLALPEPLNFTHARKQKAQIEKASLPLEEERTLSAEQAVVLEHSLAKECFHVQCLEGVTGSGKTEIYLRRIPHLLKQGKQILILVPEIGLTPQTVSRFESRFQEPVVLLHSGLNKRERKSAILRALKGEAKIIIGTRSAIFVPTQHLGLIIVDEEHDLSFKQQHGLRYHARDVAIKRAQLENIPILLGSATPSLETLAHALSGKYLHLSLNTRVQGRSLPRIYCIDLKVQKKVIDGLSQALIAAIRKHLDQGNQVLIFINRRGFSPLLICHGCGWQALCPRCDKAYTLHLHPTRLHCHHCESQKPVPL